MATTGWSLIIGYSLLLRETCAAVGYCGPVPQYTDFMAIGNHSLLWHMATTHLSLTIGAIVHITASDVREPIRHAEACMT